MIFLCGPAMSGVSGTRSLGKGKSCPVPVGIQPRGLRGSGEAAQDRDGGRLRPPRSARNGSPGFLPCRKRAPGPSPGGPDPCLQHEVLPVCSEDAAGPEGQGNPVRPKEQSIPRAHWICDNVTGLLQIPRQDC